jgi:hypothetical protein
VALVCIAAILVPLLPWILAFREFRHDVKCDLNMTCIQLAIQAYQDHHHAPLPPSVPDKDGRPAHSWRVMILPFCLQTDLYQQYDFSEPWDGPHNRSLLNRMPALYRCPSRRPGNPGFTNYLLLPNSAFFGTLSKRAPPKLREGGFWLVEVPDSNVPWTQPHDLNAMEFAALVKRTFTPDGQLREGARAFLVLPPEGPGSMRYEP